MYQNVNTSYELVMSNNIVSKYKNLKLKNIQVCKKMKLPFMNSEKLGNEKIKI